MNFQKFSKKCYKKLKNRENDAATAKLRSILEDAELNDTIRQRVTQLLISLGIDPLSI